VRTTRSSDCFQHLCNVSHAVLHTGNAVQAVCSRTLYRLVWWGGDNLLGAFLHLQLREAKAAEKAQFRALHEQKYLPLKKRCAAAERWVPAMSCASLNTGCAVLRPRCHAS
jgi:hypothetical protein